MILCKVGEGHIFKHRLYISALEQARMLILGKYVLLIFINTVYAYCHAFVKCRRRINILVNGLYISALEHVMKVILCSCVLLVFINRICKCLSVI